MRKKREGGTAGSSVLPRPTSVKSAMQVYMGTLARERMSSFYESRLDLRRTDMLFSFDIPEDWCGFLGHKHRWHWAAWLCEKTGHRIRLFA